MWKIWTVDAITQPWNGLYIWVSPHLICIKELKTWDYYFVYISAHDLGYFGSQAFKITLMFHMIFELFTIFQIFCKIKAFPMWAVDAMNQPWNGLYTWLSEMWIEDLGLLLSVFFNQWFVVLIFGPSFFKLP